jgi:hypothetical protein
MSYDYIGLVNEVNRRLNEVELVSGNFATAKGFYSQIKDSVNSSIRDINQTHYEWPFNHVLAEDTLTAGTTVTLSLMMLGRLTSIPFVSRRAPHSVMQQ